MKYSIFDSSPTSLPNKPSSWLNTQIIVSEEGKFGFQLQVCSQSKTSKFLDRKEIVEVGCNYSYATAVAMSKLAVTDYINTIKEDDLPF